MQMQLDFDKPIEPVDTHLSKAEKPRLSRQSRQILERLSKGPAINTELMEIAQRFGARIHDIRKAGYRVEIIWRDNEKGLVCYELKKEQQ